MQIGMQNHITKQNNFTNINSVLIANKTAKV